MEYQPSDEEAQEFLEGIPDEAQPESEGTPQEEQGEDAGDRPRDPDTGRFVSQEEHERLLAGKYKTPDELEKAYEELARAYGEQGNEVGQYRQWYQAQQQAQAPKLSDDYIDQLIEERPEAVVSYAMQQNDPVLYRRAMETMYETRPFEANELHSRILLQQQQQQLQQALAPIQQQQLNYALQQAWTTAQQRYQDLPQYAETMLQVAESQPALLAQLESGTVEQRQQVIEGLYLMARGMQTVGGQPAPQGHPANPAQAALQQKLAATVASGTGATGDPSQKSRIERFYDAWDNDPEIKRLMGES